MKNLKVRQKLIISFLIVAIITAAVGVIGVMGLIQLSINQDAMHMLGVNNDYVASLVETIQRERIAFRDAVLFRDDPQRLSSAIAQLDSLDEEYHDIFKHLQENLVTSQSRAFLSEIDSVYENEFTPKKILLVQELQEGDDEAIFELIDEIAKPIGVIVNAANGLIDFAAQYSKEVSDRDGKTANRMTAILAGLAAVAVVGAVLMGLFISQQLVKPLLKMKVLMDQVGNTGCLEFSPEEMSELEQEALGRDEIHQSIASALKMIHHFERVSEVLRRVADDDLTAEFENLSENDTLGVSLHLMLDNLNAIFREIHTTSSQVSTGAAEVSQGAQGLASGSTEQAASVQQFTATLAEMQERTDVNAERSAKARDANNKGGEKLADSIRSMGEMLEAMKAIDESSSNITKVIKVIDDIAFQTNILALNAAVEAARAGQHGKGFAVVADEVRNLAAKSAEAAKETAELIEGSSGRVREGNQIVEKTNLNLEAVASSARESTRLIEMVAQETNNQAQSIMEINQGIAQISAVVQANSATAEQSAAASEQMSAQAMVLDQIVARFKLRHTALRRKY